MYPLGSIFRWCHPHPFPPSFSRWRMRCRTPGPLLRWLETPRGFSPPSDTVCVTFALTPTQVGLGLGSLGLSATSQHYFSLTTNQPLATSHQYSSLRRDQHQPSATSQPNRLYTIGKVLVREHLLGGGWLGLSSRVGAPGQLQRRLFLKNMGPGSSPSQTCLVFLTVIATTHTLPAAAPVHARILLDPQ
jgi:hypothetical protein